MDKIILFIFLFFFITFQTGCNKDKESQQSMVNACLYDPTGNCPRQVAAALPPQQVIVEKTVYIQTPAVQQQQQQAPPNPPPQQAGNGQQPPPYPPPQPPQNGQPITPKSVSDAQIRAHAASVSAALDSFAGHGRGTNPVRYVKPIAERAPAAVIGATFTETDSAEAIREVP